MRWLRSLRQQDAGPSRSDALAELELALQVPARHTWVLVAVAEEPRSREYARIVTALEGWPPNRWLELDASRLDAWTSYGADVAPADGWDATLRNPDTPTLLLVLASSHPDGFLRERAARLLAERAGSLTSAALAVRASDHVEQVREIARQALFAHNDDADAALVVPILLATRDRRAAAGVFEEYLRGLSPETLRSLAHSQGKETRRFAIERATFTPGELVDLAATDGDIGPRLAAARRALAQDKTLAADLLAVAPASVRALAVSVADEALLRPRLEQLLLDRSAHLRRAAQTRAQTLGIDSAALYRDHLPKRAAVLGLGETGSDADADRLITLLSEQQPPAVRRAAVRALARLSPDDVLLRLLPPLLESDQPSLAREAGRQLHRIGYSLAGAEHDQALASPHVWTRQAALRIALGHRGWDTPVAALTLYDDPDENLREQARSALNDWLARKAASAGTPTGAQAERLTASLERADLSPRLDRSIRFHAGLPAIGGK